MTESVSNENVKRILALLRSGDEKINLSGYRNVILVIGNTGSGKSTLTHFLAGNNDELVSSEVGENSGEFIISDNNNKISVNSTVISKTTFPETVVDAETKLVFIDCPGFNDSRSEAYDIAAAYFIKKVLENVKNVKIVLTVSYPSLRKGVNRIDFLQLLEHVGILIKNIEKYVDGVALIATKVDNTFTLRNGAASMVPDSSIIQNIGQFLLEVRESTKTMKNLDKVYTSEFKRAENEVFFESSRKLLDTLVQKNGTEYTRLGIFRRPDGPGRISESKLLQHGKKVLKKMIKNNTKYVPVDMSDIGYAVSDKSKNIIRDLVEEIDKNIIADVAQVNDVLINHLKELEVKLAQDDMYSLRDHFKATSKALAQISSIRESAKADEFVSLMQANLSESCRRASEASLNDVKNLNKFLNFLQEVSDKQFESSAWKWVKELEPAINYVENSLKWYDFLAALHKRLSEYDIQKDTKRFHVPKFETSSGLLGSYVDFTNFFNEIGSAEFLKVVNLKDLQKVNIDETKVRYFNQVIESTLHDSAIYFGDDDTIFQAIGEYIKLSDVVAHEDYIRTRSAQILAKHTVFIDTDLAKDIDISIIAPNWDIIGSRTISLDGASGGHHDILEAADGDANGDPNGQDGLPGKPGKSAGHFFGLGVQFKGAENLTISATGGSGGFGQHGGDGAAGADGKSHEIRNHQYFIRCDRDEECSTEIDYVKSGLFNLNVRGQVSYTKYGDAGGRGGNAGRGGAPGIGGNPGTITLLGLGHTKPPVSHRVGKGQDGGFGLHGDCGTGGQGGRHQKAWYHFGTWKDTENWVDRFTGRAQDGEMGTCLHYSSMYNANSKNRKEPDVKKFLYPPSFVLGDFRNVLIGNLNNSVKKHHSLEFYKTLQRKEIIQYDNAELIFKELQSLEKHSSQIAPEINQFLYTLLMERIRESAKTSDNNKRLVDFLSSAVTSKLIRLQNKSESRLINNTKTYFDLLKTADVAKIHTFFLGRTYEEIESTKTFLKVIRDHVFDTIAKTTGEIVKLSQQDTDNELSNQLLKLKLFFNLRTVEEFLMFATSLAEADVSLVSNLNLISGSSSPLTEISMAPVDGSKISALLYIIEKPIKSQIEAVRSSVSKEREALEALGMEFDEIVYRLREIDVDLESRLPNVAESYVHPAFSKITDISRSLFSINGALMNEANVKAREAQDRLDQDLMLIKFDANIYNILKTKEIDTMKLIESIDEYPDRAVHIDQTATELLNVIGPVFHSVRNSLSGDKYKPANLPELRAAVLQALSDLKLQVYKLIDQFEIDEDLQLIVENMDEAISQMTSIFSGVLTSHEDRAKLRSYSKYLEKEKELGNHRQNYLIDVVKTNTLVYEYERLVDIFKKLISPFNAQTLDPPPLLPLGQSMTAFQTSFVANVKIFESKLESLQQSSKNDTISEAFNSSNQNGAFFSWKKDNYKESISKLLYGRAVALKAPNGNKNRQFLKFDDIKLRFKASDPNTQLSLDEDMQNFNVIMTHTGNSYYSLCDRITLISQDSTRFVYNVNETVTRVDSNDAQIKPVLSPYTTWIFQLIPVHENVTFSSLIPYRKSGIDVELEGHATFFNMQNKTVCQTISHSGFETNQPLSTPASLIRKRREINSSEGVFDSNPSKSWNPFNYLVGREPNPEFGQSSNIELLESNDNVPNQPTTLSPSLNVNAALTLVDFMVRKIFKVKPPQTREKSASAEEAHVIALNILHKYENMLVELSDRKLVSMSDWEQQDPVEMMSLLEKYILTEDYSKIIDLLSRSVTLEPSVEGQLRQELVQVVSQSLDGSVIRNEYEDNYGSARTEGGLFDDYTTNGGDLSSYDNFNRLLLN